MAEKTHLSLLFQSVLFLYSPGFPLHIWNYDFHQPFTFSSVYCYFTSSAAGRILECLGLSVHQISVITAICQGPPALPLKGYLIFAYD